MSVLYIKDEQGKWQAVPAIQGRTPVLGVDYFTEADKQEIQDSVVDSLMAETWVFTLEDGTVIEKQVLVR